MAFFDHPAPVTQIIAPYLHRSPFFASFVKLPTDSSRPMSYDDLACSAEDEQKVAFLIETIANNGKCALLLRTSELKRVGAELNHVHPLRFLATLCKNPNLKACLKEIYKDGFKWQSLMGGLGPSLTNQSNCGTLEPYLEKFAQEVNASLEIIREYAKNHDWNNLVHFLMNQ